MEQGWRSGESSRLRPNWPGFDSWTRRYMWVEFVVGSRPCSERFFSGYSCPFLEISDNLPGPISIFLNALTLIKGMVLGQCIRRNYNEFKI